LPSKISDTEIFSKQVRRFLVSAFNVPTQASRPN